MANVVWSLPFIALIGGAIVILQYRDANKVARVKAANATLHRAVSEAEHWLSQGSGPGDAIERNLQSAFSDASVSDTGGAAALLDRVRLKRSQFAADGLFRNALTALDARDTTWATELFQEYLKNEHSTRKEEAQRLASEISLSLDQARALETLVAMNDQTFEAFRSGGDFADSEITHPALREVHAETLRARLNDAIHRREERRIAQAQLREAERVAASERQKREKERMRQEEELWKREKEQQQREQEIRLAEERRSRREEAEREEAIRRAAEDVVRAVAEKKSEEASLKFVVYVTSLSSSAQRDLEPALTAMVVLKGFYLDPGTNEVYYVMTTKNPIAMRGLVRLKPICDPIMVVKDDGEWTTYGELITQAVKDSVGIQ